VYTFVTQNASENRDIVRIVDYLYLSDNITNMSASVFKPFEFSHDRVVNDLEIVECDILEITGILTKDARLKLEAILARNPNLLADLKECRHIIAADAPIRLSGKPTIARRKYIQNVPAKQGLAPLL
jgi:hypothetical protein